MLAGATHVLAGEPSAQNVRVRNIRSPKAAHIIIYMYARPVPRENGPAKRVNLAKELMMKTRPGKAQVAQTGPAEQAAY
jgi:hypothetical protein